MADVLFGVGAYESRSNQLAAQRMVNCFFESQPPQQAKGQTPIFGTPGLTPWATMPERPLRGFWSFNGVLYVVAGQSLYRVNAAAGFKKIGSGISGTQPVRMSDNGVQIMAVNGLGGYLADTSDKYQQIQNANFYSASTILFFDGYFVFDRKGTNEFILSSLYDGTMYSGLDFASAEAQPGFLSAVAQNLQLLFLFAQNHIEMWYDAGAADFPFQRYAGGVIEKGCIAPLTVIAQDEALFFLGADKVFYRLQGNVPQRISNHGVEHAISTYADVSDAFCFTYTLEGHKMVHLTFPSAGASWVYDISTRMWHERESRDALGNRLQRWRGNCAIEIYNRILIGDAFSGAIYVLDWDNYTEAGNPMEFLATSITYAQDRMPIFCNLLELDMQVGYGLRPGGMGPITEASPAPVAMLRYSRDGGVTWSKLQRWRSLGKVGEYIRRLRWLSMGRAYQYTFELTISDPVPRVLIGTHADIEAGMP